MASQLQDNLNEILRQKNAYLLPNNIKSGVEVLGVTGNLEVGINTNLPTATYTASGTNPFTLNTTTGYYEYSGAGDGVLTIDITAIESGTMNINYKGHFIQGGESQTNLYLDNTLVDTLDNQTTYTDYPIQLSSAGSHTVRIEVLSDDARTTMEVKLKIEQPITSNTVLNGYTGFVNGQKVLGTLAPSEDLNTELNAQDQKLAELEAVVYNATQPQSKPNIFVQLTEPETKKGIWLQKEATPEHYTYDDDVFIGGTWMSDGTKADVPVSSYYGSAVAIGTNIYIFGGASGTNAYKYNTLTNTYTKLTNVPYVSNYSSCAYIGTDIYLFGGGSNYNSNTLYNAYKYDTLTNTYTQLTNIPYKSFQSVAVAVDTDIYLFSGYVSGTERYAYKYDTLTGTYTKLTNVPADYYNGSGVSIGTNIYLFGGTRYPTLAYKYDTSTDTYTQLTNIPYSCNAGCTATVGTNIYIFGGTSSSNRNAYKYDTLTDTYTQLTNIPYGFQDGNSVAVGNNIYLLGSVTTDNYYRVQVYALESKTYSQDNLVVINQGKYASVGYEIELYSNSKDVTPPKYAFADAWYYTLQDGLETNIPTYYGDGTNWVKIKN